MNEFRELTRSAAVSDSDDQKPVIKKAAKGKPIALDDSDDGELCC